MRKLHIGIASTLLGTALALGFSSTALAWHPQGTITKTVQDVTTNSAVSAATSASTALTVSSGDTLSYSVVIANGAAPAANHDNDMASTVMTDTLPAGTELISNPAQRQITENIGTILPGNKVTKTYSVKVTSVTEGTVITNTACFTGNSVVNDNPQQGCSTVVVKVHVPPTPTYACTLLNASQINGRTIKITAFQPSASNGATFNNVIIDWGDNTTQLTTANAVGQTHTYANDGTYRVVATAHFTVNGVDQSATSNTCASPVTVSSTPSTPPAQLPNTGAGNVIVPVAAISLGAYLFYALSMKRRVSKR